MKKSLVAVMLGLMMTIAMTGCGGCGAEEVAIETEATEVVEETEEVVEETEVEATEEVAEETTEEPAEEEVEETPVEEASPYTYTELNQVMYAQSTVNVRDLPEQTGGKIGSLTTNQEVTVTGQCNETGWYRISYNGGEGFVSNSYLGTEKVAVQSSSSGGSSGSSTPAESSAPTSESVPAESSDTGAGEVWTEERVLDSMTAEEAAADNTLTPDSYHCPFCGAEYPSYEEAVAHSGEVHGWTW